MKVLVSDSSVLFDLLRYELIESLTGLPYEFIIADITLEEELFNHGAQTVDLIKALFQVETLTAEEVTLVSTLGSRFPGLSVPDCAALALVENRRLALLAGDGLMRNVATEMGHEVRGTLWVMDEYLDKGLIRPSVLLRSLERMLQDPRIRLPRTEIGRRIRKLESLK